MDYYYLHFAGVETEVWQLILCISSANPQYLDIWWNTNLNVLTQVFKSVDWVKADFSFQNMGGPHPFSWRPYKIKVVS